MYLRTLQSFTQFIDRNLSLSLPFLKIEMEKTTVTSVAVTVAWIVFAAVLTWTWRALDWVWLRPRRLERRLRQQGLVGNPYRFLHGDLKENSAMRKKAISEPIGLSDDIVPRVLPLVHKTVQIYGKDCFTWVGPIPRVNVMKPEQIREVFLRYNDFQKPALNPLSRLLVNGLESMEGEDWARHRKILNPAFHPLKLKLMLSAMELSCSQMMEEWEKRLISSNHGGWCELDVWPYLQRMTADVIARTAFGSSFKEGIKIFELQHEQTSLVVEVIQSVYIPGWSFLPTKRNRRMKSIEKEVRALLGTMINERHKEMRAGKASKDDLLGMMLESNSKDIQEQSKKKKKAGMCIKEVIEECKLFYLAGQETTSVLLVWTMVLLGEHPQWQVRAREEVLQAFGNQKPDFDGLGRLKIVSMILNEVLRLYPPVALVTRKVIKEANLGELVLPSGVQVSVPIILAHHDPQLWGKDAKEFQPERFSEGVVKATKGKVCFFPFTWGPRICIGQNFAMLEAKMALSMILQRFSFQLSSSYVHAPFMTITIQPQNGASFVFCKI